MSGWRPSMILVWKPSRTKRQCEQWQKVDLRLFGTDPQFKIKRQTSSCEMSIWWDSINTTHIHPLHFQFFNTTAIPDRWTRAHLHLQMEVGHGRNHPGDCEDWHASYAWFGNLYLERFAQGYGGIRYHWYHNQQSWIGSAIGGAVQRWCLIPFSLWLTTDWLIFFGKAWEACNIWATTLLALLDGWNSNILEHLRWLRVLDPAETYGNFFSWTTPSTNGLKWTAMASAFPAAATWQSCLEVILLRCVIQRSVALGLYTKRYVILLVYPKGPKLTVRAKLDLPPQNCKVLQVSPDKPLEASFVSRPLMHRDLWTGFGGFSIPRSKRSLGNTGVENVSQPKIKDVMISMASDSESCEKWLT